MDSRLWEGRTVVGAARLALLWGEFGARAHRNWISLALWCNKFAYIIGGGGLVAAADRTGVYQSN